MLYEILPDPRKLLIRRHPVDQVLQIHRPIPEQVPVGHFEQDGSEVVDEVVSRDTYLGWLQAACAELEDRLEVRFYDHFEEEFDASVLDRLDEIRCLSIDGLAHLTHPEAVGRLPKLSHLRFGPYRVANSRILGALGVHRLADFTLAGSPTPTVDLTPLADATSLRALRILGKSKNMEAIARITSLTELALQPSSQVSLEFLSGLSSLQTLKLVLGNTVSISSIEDLPALQDLSVYEVHYFEDLGDLQRFPGLRRLQVSDQPRITEIHVGRLNQALEHLYLYSVPGLQDVRGFSELPAVKSLFTYDSRLYLPWSDLPPTLTHFQLMTKALRGRDAHDAEVREKGLIPSHHPEAVFFYK